MRSIVGLLLAVSLGAAVHAAEAPAPVWVVSGFEMPESALYVKAENAIFVSNVAGDPAGRNGKGFISRLDGSGKLLQREWLTGLNAPKGLGYAQGRLFVADIDELVEIDVETATVARRYPAPGARMLNDVALEPRSHFAGQVPRVWVSDWFGDAIWYLADGKFSELVRDPALQNPNGLLVENETLRIASWGVMTDGFKTEVPGRLLSMDLDQDGIADRFSAVPMGNLDGLEPDGKGGYWVSDWVAGKIFHVAADGSHTVWLQLEPGTADLGIVPGKWLLVPMMMNNELRAYALPKK